MKITRLLVESWHINVDFPVRIDEFNLRMKKHNVQIVWKKHQKQDVRKDRGSAYLQVGDGEGDHEWIELIVSSDGYIMGAVGRVHTIAGDDKVLNKLKWLLDREFGKGEWSWEDEDEDEEDEEIPIRSRMVKNLPKHYKPETTHPGALRGEKTKHLGSGSYASTYAHDDKPHDVRRVSRVQSSHDGSYWYVKELQKHPDRNNPYFPKYREGTEYHKRRSDATVLSMSMERLQHLDTLSRKEAESVFERWFGEHYEYIIWNKIFQEHPVHTPLSPKNDDDVALIVAAVTSRIVQHDWISKYVVDSKLKHAAQFIRKLKEKHSRTYDLSYYNIMFRRSPQGIQIVITDPLA